MINWVKTHKFILFLCLVIIYLALKNNNPIAPFLNQSINGLPEEVSYAQPAGRGFDGFDMAKTSVPMMQSAPSATTANRIVIQESNMSLLVTHVRGTSDKILNFAKTAGGYMVNAYYSNPTESPFASVTVRVPTQKLTDALSYFKKLAIKVTNENLMGTDVTQEYTDIEARLATLKKTQAKFEDIMDKAIDVQDILTVQRELINLQDQIDMYIGQQKAMEKNAELTKITVYLSSDELALPYTPDKAFRPNVVFKLAVRSLLDNLRVAAETLIWIAVYLPVIAILVLVALALRRLLKKKMASK